jgi:16S rRNA (cytosine967-C5)-methyltransferase
MSDAPALPLATLLLHCAQTLEAVRSGTSLTAALERCPAPARAGTQALSFHALRWWGTAQVVRQRLVARRPPPGVDALLLAALTLFWPAAAPPYAEHTVVDQAVNAARRKVPRSAAFVNATLRRFLRERDAICRDALRDPLACFNHPAWWIDRLRRDWPRQWQAILDADNRHPPMFLRVNARRCSVAGYLERLAESGIAGRAGVGHCISLAQPCPVSRLPGFAQGDVSVQDAAAQLAAPLLQRGLRARARVLDACAAPGGKTAHLLELADFDVLALDRDEARLARVEQTLDRLGLHARTRCADATDPAAWWDGERFDAILLDAPCSASGIVRRHPDVRWLRRASDVPALAATQARLLDALWPLLAAGGRLLYCTCSVFRAEGQDQIDAFLQRRNDATLATDPVAPGHLLPLPDNPEQPDPSTPGTPGDGFYYALIEKLQA